MASAAAVLALACGISTAAGTWNLLSSLLITPLLMVATNELFEISIERIVPPRLVSDSGHAYRVYEAVRDSGVFAGAVDVSDAVQPPGYGRLNDAVREALLLDPVYTGKAMAGLLAHVRAGRIAAGSRVLFLHTGGQPALFAYADKLDSCLMKAPWAPAR